LFASLCLSSPKQSHGSNIAGVLEREPNQQPKGYWFRETGPVTSSEDNGHGLGTE